MDEIRFLYLPFDKMFFDCPSSHTDKIHDLKDTKNFDQYIRGIIKNKVLYLRVFYPFNDIDSLTYDQLIYKSNMILSQYIKEIKDLIKSNYKFTPKKIKISVTNIELKGILKTI